MKTRKKVSLLLVASLTAQLLSGCRFIVPSDKPLAAPNFEGGRYGNSEDWGKDNSTVAPSDTPSQDPDKSTAVWNAGHVLGVDLPEVDGLELPVVGATGYTSIDLYLWKDQPTDACKVVYVSSRDNTAAAPAASPSPLPSWGTGTTTPGWGTDTTTPNWGTAGTIPAVPQASVTYDDAQNTPTVRPLSASSGSVAVKRLKPGTPFTILREVGDWWYVRADNQVGWVEHRYCLINLPDVIPSMIYDDTNSYSSVFRASFKDIPNITEKQLYNARAYNARLGRDEFLMPVLYAMSKKICQAQQNALASGNTIVLYEGFRPYDTQIQVAREVTAMAKTDAEVKAGISTYPWSISWFIATGISNHQEGYAMDVSLAKITRAQVKEIDGYSFVSIDECEFYTMPTPIHELSKAACTYTGPVSILSATAWKSGTMTAEMAANEPAKALQRYCTDAGMTPLASEWWHFNDLNAYSMTSGHHSTGKYYIETCMSLRPNDVQY